VTGLIPTSERCSIYTHTHTHTYTHTHTHAYTNTFTRISMLRLGSSYSPSGDEEEEEEEDAEEDDDEGMEGAESDDEMVDGEGGGGMKDSKKGRDKGARLRRQVCVFARAHAHSQDNTHTWCACIVHTCVYHTRMPTPHRRLLIRFVSFSLFNWVQILSTGCKFFLFLWVSTRTCARMPEHMRTGFPQQGFLEPYVWSLSVCLSICLSVSLVTCVRLSL